MSLQSAPEVTVIDEAQRFESIHEEANPRPRSTDHLCQSRLIQTGNCRIRCIFLSEQQKNPCESLITGVAMLVNQIFLVSDVLHQ